MTESKIPRARLVELLSPTVGVEKSQALVDEAASGLGLGAAMNAEQARRVLEQIARRGGVIGAAARLAATRLETSGVQARPQAYIDLTTQLAPALGHERAVEQVTACCRKLGLDPMRLDRQSALRVLDLLGNEAGISGVTARFVKARLLLSA